jgi:hypothetical protein
MRPIRWAVLAAAFALTACATPPPENFSKVALAARPDSGAIMFTAPVFPYAYMIWFAPLRPDRTVGNAVLFAVTQRSVIEPKTGLSLHLKPAKAGDYVVRVVTWQGMWGACLSDDTARFRVEPGRIAYLGAVDPVPTLRSIEAEAARLGKTTASAGSLRLMKKNVSPPGFALAGAPPPDEMIEVAKAHGLSSALPVVPAETAAATFVRKDKTDLTGYCA